MIIFKICQRFYRMILYSPLFTQQESSYGVNVHYFIFLLLFLGFSQIKDLEQDLPTQSLLNFLGT